MARVVIITAKGGNLSLKDKHLALTHGKPLLFYPMKAALEAKRVDAVFLSTEDSRIRKLAVDAGLRVIDRPAELARPDTNIGDAIFHAVQEIKRNHFPNLSIVVSLLGNTVTIDGDLIDKSIELLVSNPNADSCMTVWKAQDDHPMRAMVVGSDGYLTSYTKNLRPDTNRQSYPDVFFYDQGPWTFRADVIFAAADKRSQTGPGPWWWMGDKSIALERPWITGRDVHTDMDIWMCEKWLEADAEWKSRADILGSHKAPSIFGERK